MHRLPEYVSFAQGALVEPLATTASTFEHIKLSIGDNMVIVGPGVQGLLHTQVARAGGAAKIIVAGLCGDSTRLEMASDKVDVEVLISHRLSLGEAETGILPMKESTPTKVLLYVGE